MTKPLTSLSIFFPFYNDAGTVAQAISSAYEIGKTLTNNLEVIALHGGPSRDNTWQEILSQKKLHSSLKVIDKNDNTVGYAVIKHGFDAALNDWVFYTDGDLQYDLKDLHKLVQIQRETGADVINGYKKNRADSFSRQLLGTAYQWISQKIFQLPIRDTDCDFRLIRRSFLKKIALNGYKSSILPELIKKLEYNGATFAEADVSHIDRTYGQSNYHVLYLFFEKLYGDLGLWFTLKKYF